MTIVKARIRYMAEAKQREQRLRRHNNELAILNQVANSLASSLRLETILADIARLCCTLMDMTSAYVGYVDFEAHTSKIIAEYITPESTGLEARSEVGIVYNLERDLPRFYQWLMDPPGDYIISHLDDESLSTAGRQHLQQHGGKSLLSVPLKVQGRVWGYIELWETREKREFPEEDTRLIHSIATQAGLAIANGRLYEDMAESTERFRQLAENIEEVFWLMDAHKMRVEYISPAFDKIWGRPRQELYEDLNNVWDYIHPHDINELRHAFYAQYEDARRGRMKDRYERTFRVRRSDGHIRWVRSLSFPVHNREGEVYRFATISEDITAQKQAENELRMARDAAEAANRAKSAFLANMSHELRTPLNAIIGYTDLLLEGFYGDLNSKQLDRLLRIRTSGHQLLQQIDMVLDLTKIEAEKMELHPVPFAVEDLVREVTDTIEPLIATNHNILNVERTGNLGTMHTDQVKTRQILLNLLSNAIKFTEHGTITLRVERLPTDQVRFEVIDTGIGMSDEELKNIFNLFTQADSSTTRRYGGTGLGLTICRRYCDLLKGSIEVQSEVNVGSTFTVLLPIDLTVSQNDHDSQP
jgi:PAS domain S-box-containing protein